MHSAHRTGFLRPPSERVVCQHLAIARRVMFVTLRTENGMHDKEADRSGVPRRVSSRVLPADISDTSDMAVIDQLTGYRSPGPGAHHCPEN